MPHARKYRKRGNKKNNYRRRGKRMSKLLDSKINTKFEVAAQRIARAEIAKNRVNLIFRRYLFGTYTPSTNAFAADTTDINHSGIFVNIGRILRADIDVDTAINVAADDPYTMLVDETNTGNGVAHGLYTQTSHGRMISDTVKITGISLSLRCYLKESSAQPTRQEAVLSYAIVRVQDDWQQNPVPLEPVVDEMLKWYPFGYTPALDTDPTVKNATRKIHTVLRGKLVFTPDDAGPRDKTIKRFVKFKTPWTYQVAPDEQIDNAIKYKTYLVLRSNIPDAAVGSVNEELFPKVWACTKLYYYEP